MSLHILVVEDDVSSREAFQELLTSEGHTVECSGALADATARIEHDAFDCILLDRNMPDGDGIDYAFAHGWCSLSEVVVITGKATVDSAVEACPQGAADYLTKPVDRAAPQGRARQRRAHPLAQGRGAPTCAASCASSGASAAWSARSPAMQAVYDLIERVAPTDGQRADHRRERHRQGAGGRDHPPAEPAARRAVRGGQLRRASRRT